MTLGGTDTGGRSRPVARASQATRRGIVAGNRARPITDTTVSASIAGPAPASIWFTARQPVPSAIAAPAAMFTIVFRIADPAAAAGDTPSRRAITPMAPIVHSLPGT